MSQTSVKNIMLEVPHNRCSEQWKKFKWYFQCCIEGTACTPPKKSFSQMTIYIKSEHT